MSNNITTAFAAAAPSIDNQTLGALASALDPAALGAVLRPLLVAHVPTPAGGGLVDTKSSTLPDNFTAMGELMDNVYDAFTDYRRRSLGALANITGLTPDAVTQLLENNEDFRFSNGSDTGRTYVSLSRSLR